MVLYTSTAEIDSEAMLAKSNEREPDRPPPPLPRLEAGIWRPLSSTRLKSGPMPRTVTLEPSPLEVRSIDTPLMRCSDSARLVSGNLPMSSATMPSTTPWLSRLRFIDDVRLPRIPVTCTASSVVGSGLCGEGVVAGSCAQAGLASTVSSAEVSIALRGTTLYVFIGSSLPRDFGNGGPTT
ncbi:hypothetical protein D3C81_1574260 [compost metagenome]